MVDLVSVAYRMDLELSSWVGTLMHTARPLLDRGLGLMAWSCRVSADGHTFTSPIARTEGITDAVIAACVENSNSLSGGEVAAAHTNQLALDTASRSMESFFGAPFEEWPKFDAARAVGLADCLAAKGFDPAGFGFMLAAPLPVVERVPVGDERGWAKVMAHVVAGARLRAGLPLPEDGEAVLDPAGRVVHAEGEARSRSARGALRHATMEIDRARSVRTDPERALSIWKGLVAGRWSLVDRFDSDGRRYVIARRNDPEVDGPTALTARERQVLAYAAQGHSNDHIAYALGLSPSTISTHLSRAMRRLGIRQIADLAALFAPPREPAS